MLFKFQAEPELTETLYLMDLGILRTSDKRFFIVFYNKSLVTSEISDHKKQQMKTKEIICTLLFLASIGVIIGREGKYFLIKTQKNSTGLDETDWQADDDIDLQDYDDMDWQDDDVMDLHDDDDLDLQDDEYMDLHDDDDLDLQDVDDCDVYRIYNPCCFNQC